MKEYAVSLIAVTALISFSLVAFYNDGKNERTVRCALAAILLYAVLLPLLNGAVPDLGKFELKFNTGAYDFSDADATQEMTEAAFQNGIRLFLADEFSLNAEDISVYTDGFDMAEMKAQRITVRLSGGAIYADRYAIREKIEKNGLGSCEVKIEG